MNTQNLHSDVYKIIDHLKEDVDTLVNEVDELSRKKGFREIEKNIMQTIPITIAHNIGDIPMCVGDMNRNAFQNYGPGILLLGYVNSSSGKWAYAPDEFGRVIDVDGKTLKNSKTWTRVHEVAKSTGLIEAQDAKERKYQLIAANEGYVPARMDDDPQLQGWSDLNSEIHAIFDRDNIPHPACEQLDYTKHGFTLHTNKVWWPIDNPPYVEASAKEQLRIAKQNLPDATSTLSPKTQQLDQTVDLFSLSSEILTFTNLLNALYATLDQEKIPSDIPTKIYVQIAKATLTVHKNYEKLPIEKKLQYLTRLAKSSSDFQAMNAKIPELTERFNNKQVIDFLAEAKPLLGLFVIDFKIMTKNGLEPESFFSIPLKFWTDTLKGVELDFKTLQLELPKNRSGKDLEKPNLSEPDSSYFLNESSSEDFNQELTNSLNLSDFYVQQRALSVTGQIVAPILGGGGGAAVYAGIGFLFGGPIGAAIGGGIGLVSGWIGTDKAFSCQLKKRSPGDW